MNPTLTAQLAHTRQAELVAGGNRRRVERESGASPVRPAHGGVAFLRRLGRVVAPTAAAAARMR